MASITELANNRKIWRNLRDVFPHPYREEHARWFIEQVKNAQRETSFAIDVEGNAVGVISVRLKEDIERANAELGYWIGEPYWGRGLMTEVVRAFSEFALEDYSLNRLEAWVFAWNLGSARVLEKAGYEFEGRMRRAAVKDGEVVDRLIYGFVRG